jgi:hypothetical protein
LIDSSFISDWNAGGPPAAQHNASTSVLDFVAHLLKSRPGDPQRLTRATGMPVKRVPSSDPTTSIFESEGPNRAKTILITSQSGSAEQSLIAVQLPAGQQLTAKQFETRFGRVTNMRLPTPRQPAGSPKVYTLTGAAGALDLLVANDGTEVVREVRFRLPE